MDIFSRIWGEIWLIVFYTVGLIVGYWLGKRDMKNQKTNPPKPLLEKRRVNRRRRF